MALRKHSRGPWRRGEGGGSGIFSASGRIVAACTTSDPNDEHEGEAEANANLIAAAPDLLLSLLWALDTMAEPLHEDSLYGRNYRLAQAAISDALGELDEKEVGGS